MKGVSPPPFSAWLIACVSTRDGGTLQGDLEEEFRTIMLPRLGPGHAQRWYRRQVITSLYSLAVFAVRDMVWAGMAALAGLLAWYAAVHAGMSLILATPAPFEAMSDVTFALVFVLGGGLVGGFVGVLFQPRRPHGVAVVAGWIGISLLFLGVDEQIRLGYQLSWASAATIGAFLGVSLGNRWKTL